MSELKELLPLVSLALAFVAVGLSGYAIGLSSSNERWARFHARRAQERIACIEDELVKIDARK